MRDGGSSARTVSILAVLVVGSLHISRSTRVAQAAVRHELRHSEEAGVEQVEVVEHVLRIAARECVYSTADHIARVAGAWNRHSAGITRPTPHARVAVEKMQVVEHFVQVAASEHEQLSAEHAARGVARSR